MILRSKTIVSVVIAIALGLLVGCAQPAPTPTPTQPPKATAAKEAAPAPKATAAKEATAAPKEPTKEAAKPAPKPQQLTKLRVPYAAISGIMAPLWITEDRGLFEKYGLDVDIDYITSSSVLAHSMVSGEINVAQAGANAVVSANLAGADIVMIGGTANNVNFWLFTRPEITKIQDLKGKAVGVGRFGASLDFAGRQALKRNGLEPGKDVTMIEMGSSPNIAAGLDAGAIQGGVIGAPTTVQARKMGMRPLLNIADLDIPYASGAMIVNRKFLNANRETMMNFMKAIVEGIAVAKKDKEFAIKVIGKYAKIEDREVLEDTWETHLTDELPRVPYVSVEAVQTVLDEVALGEPKAKSVKPEAYIDNSLIKELETSGFIQKLYQ